jgi:hypothetical protein
VKQGYRDEGKDHIFICSAQVYVLNDIIWIQRWCLFSVCKFLLLAVWSFFFFEWSLLSGAVVSLTGLVGPIFQILATLWRSYHVLL